MIKKEIEEMESCLQKDYDVELEEISLECDLDSDIKKLKGTKLDNTPQIKKVLESVSKGEKLKEEVMGMLEDELLNDSVFYKNKAIIENSLQLDIYTKKENIKNSIQTYLKQQSK